ncbi:MAG: Hsp20/alpha crystallin family protein [Fimbriimonadaceae bacterium]|nr:Hsp20/alpha crystallin family protein [Chitinophagales bacterium]
MYNNQTSAAKGTYGGRDRHLLYRSMERAAVNIYRTEASYEMLVFAPGRIREHFTVDLEGTELTVSYSPPEGFPRPDWIRREYSRGGFTRSFSLGASIDANGITAKYEDGVLHIHLPLLAGQENPKQQIKVQ